MSVFATGAVDQIDLMELWESNSRDGERLLKKVLLDGLDMHVQGADDVLKKLKKGPSISTPVVRWYEGWGYPYSVTATLSETAAGGAEPTLTFSGSLFGSAVATSAIKKVIRDGTVLERPSDGVQIRVDGSDLSGLADAPYTVTCAAHGGSTLSDDSAAIEWQILGEPWKDRRDWDQSRELDWSVRKVGCQIHAEGLQITKSVKNTRFEVVQNMMEHQLKELLKKLRRQLAYAALRMMPKMSGGVVVYGDSVEEITMCGILSWPTITQAESANTNVYVNKSGARLVKEDIDSLVYNLEMDEYADYNEGDWWIVCHPFTHQYIHDFEIGHRRTDADRDKIGFHVNEFDSKRGKTFPILSDRYMRPGALLLCNFDKMSYGYYANDTLDRKEIATGGRYQQWLVSFQTYGVVARNPRSNIGMVYNLATT